MMEPIVLWQDKWSGDPFIPAYLFFGGLTAGLFLVAAVADLLSLKSRRLEPVSRVAAFAAVPMLALAGFFLTVHLGKPERGLGFPLFFTNYGSWMTRGGWIVGAAAPLVVVYAVLWYLGVMPRLRRVLAVLGLPLLVLFGMYTGFLLSGAGYVPLWSRRHLPLLFLTSGVTGAVALTGLVLLGLAWWRRQPALESARVRRAVGLVLVGLILVEAYELRTFVTYLEGRAPDKAMEETVPLGRPAAPMGTRLAYQYVTGGDEYPGALFRARVAEAAERPVLDRTLAPWFWFGVVGLGLLVPLVLTAVELGADRAVPRAAMSVSAVKFASVLVGGFVLRLVIVWGGDLKAPLPFPPQLWPGVLPPGLGG